MITCNMIRGRNGEWTMQFTDCGLESATLHVHMCTVEELSVIVSIYIYIQLHSPRSGAHLRTYVQ